MAQVARISGPLLAANLVRTQANLAFETDLLYIGHLNDRIGIKTSSPNAELNINGQIYTPNIYNDRLTGGNLEVNTNGVRAITCLLYTSPSPRDGLLSRMPSTA